MGVTITGRDEALDAVSERVRDTLGELARDWREIAGRGADILGEQDLPWLIERAACGGKMLRPEMVYWGWVAAGAPGEGASHVIDLGAAIELLHVFALIHDDVMDRSTLRRGHPTTQVLAAEAHTAAAGLGDATLFGDAIAVLAGDLVQSAADHLVADLPSGVRTAWRRMMIELVLGQRRDLTGAAAGRRDLPHALEVARLKSGAYTVAGPLRMGALLGDAAPEVLAALDRYAYHAGEAFALRDDVLGTWGSPRETGKPADDDLAAGKATVLLAMAADRLSPAGRELLRRAGSLSPDELRVLRDDMSRCGVRDSVEALIAAEVSRAADELTAPVPSAAVQGLLDVAKRMAWRNA